MALPGPKVVAALAIGRTSLAFAAVGLDHRVLAVRAAPNPPLASDAGPVVDGVHVWRWLVAALGSLGEAFRIE
ncbi:MAG: hypothetical protein ACOCYE_11590, partial [Pseudomonadota bacterium]